MEIQVGTQAWQEVEGDWLVVPVSESPDLGGSVGVLDKALGGTISRLVEGGDLKGKSSELLAVHDAPGIAASRILIVGLGRPEDLTRQRLEKAMTAAARKVASRKDVACVFAVPELSSTNVGIDDAVETIAVAIHAATQGQDALKKEKNHHPLESARILVAEADATAAAEAAARGVILGESINLTRELVNQPPQDLYPESFARRATEVANELGLKCEVLDQSQLEAENMGALLAVAQGSTRPPCVVSIEYQGGKADGPKLAIVGKGVTFDSGGLSIKSSDGMITMKSDMAGAATTLGAVAAIARLKLPVNVTGYMGLVENMISGNSYKLGDILRARNGVTIEVQNTDAEGRLVLADVLSLAADRGADRMIDLATLTGACVVALGEEVTGAFSNDQEWCDQLVAAAAASGENIWQMPMYDFYSDLLKSDVADCRNIGGRWGGAITAAKFLEKFVDEKPWVHLDIAGPSFASSNKSHREGGATGCMVRTLVSTAAAFQ